MSCRYKFFAHRQCEFFPCHKGADPDRFNCLFCYCPLYLVPDCGGDFTRLGTKTAAAAFCPTTRTGTTRLSGPCRKKFSSLLTKNSQRA